MLKNISIGIQGVCLVEIADDRYNVKYKKFVICIARQTPKELLLTLQDCFKDFPKHIEVSKKNNLISSAIPRQVDHNNDDDYDDDDEIAVDKKRSLDLILLHLLHINNYLDATMSEISPSLENMI